MSKKTGGPAFPTTKESHMTICSRGMTLRDYFAAKAMQGVLSGVFSLSERGELPQQELARFSYEIADAMIAEREKNDE